MRLDQAFANDLQQRRRSRGLRQLQQRLARPDAPECDGLPLQRHGRQDSPGLRCATNDDCPTPNCDSGFCRCTVHTTGPADIECGNDFNPPLNGQVDAAESGFICTTPLPGTPGSGNVCRMQHGNVTTKPAADRYFSGIRVYCDKRDRWASSRAIWNQHAYSITNVNDDGKVPRTSVWAQNFLDPKLDNYRASRQGATSADLADLTGAVDVANACQIEAGGAVTFRGRVCNRGLRDVAAGVPVEFFAGAAAVTSICGPFVTNRPVPVGVCIPVACTVPNVAPPTATTISMIVNDGVGAAPGPNRSVDECNHVNNLASVQIGACAAPP